MRPFFFLISREVLDYFGDPRSLAFLLPTTPQLTPYILADP